VAEDGVGVKTEGQKVQILRTDNGGEYTSHRFRNHSRIRHETTVPKTLEQNGTESGHRHSDVCGKIRMTTVICTPVEKNGIHGNYFPVDFAPTLTSDKNDLHSRADLCNIRSLCDENMKLGTSLLNIIKVFLRNGPASNLIFGDL
jgi:hypothetical protein